MSLSKSDLLDRAEEKFESNDTLQCWVKQEHDHQLYVFSIYFINQHALSLQWEEAKKYIAAYVQGLLLDKSVERWNLYLFFLVGESVDTNVQYTIEQDKYSTRKIVFGDVGTHPSDDDIVNLIMDTLFLLDIETVTTAKTDDINNILKSKHPAVYDFMTTHGSDKTQDVFDEMTKLLGKE